MHSRVKSTNTPLSDAQARVWHIVTDDNGKEHELYAKDPLDAIEMYKLRQENN